MDALQLQIILGKTWTRPPLTSPAEQPWCAWNGTKERLVSFLNKKEELEASRDFTPEGKAKQLATEGKAALADLARIKATIITPRKADLPKRRDAARINRPTADPVLAYLKAQEIRAHLLAVPDGDLVNILTNARRDGDLEVLEAAAGIPSYRRPATGLVNWKDLEAEVARRSLDPGKLAEIEEVEAALNRSEAAITAAEREIQSAIGQDPLLAQANPEGATA